MTSTQPHSQTDHQLADWLYRRGLNYEQIAEVLADDYLHDAYLEAMYG